MGMGIGELKATGHWESCERQGPGQGGYKDKRALRSATKKMPLSGTLTIWLWLESQIGFVVTVCFSGMSIVEG